jgi:hypothetical protein
LSTPIENPAEVTEELIAAAEKFDDNQAARAVEFERMYERVMGRKLVRKRDPVTWAWLRPYMLPKWYSCCLPGRIMPALVFGENWEKHPGYIPIERRFVLANTRFAEIYSAGDKTPRRDMVQR